MYNTYLKIGDTSGIPRIYIYIYIYIIYIQAANGPLVSIHKLASLGKHNLASLGKHNLAMLSKLYLSI